jgi:hypothetical protein
MTRLLPRASREMVYGRCGESPDAMRGCRSVARRHGRPHFTSLSLARYTGESDEFLGGDEPSGNEREATC